MPAGPSSVSTVRVTCHCDGGPLADQAVRPPHSPNESLMSASSTVLLIPTSSPPDPTKDTPCCPGPIDQFLSELQSSTPAGSSSAAALHWGGVGTAATLPLVLGPTPAPSLHSGRHAAQPGHGQSEISERGVLTAILNRDLHLATDRPGPLLIADKGFAFRQFKADLAARGITLLRPGQPRENPGSRATPEVGPAVDQVGQRHPQRPARPGTTRRTALEDVAQHVLAMITAIWHNHHTGAPTTRPLIVFDH
jgi:hypothetical protein